MVRESPRVGPESGGDFSPGRRAQCPWSLSEAPRRLSLSRHRTAYWPHYTHKPAPACNRRPVISGNSNSQPFRCIILVNNPFKLLDLNAKIDVTALAGSSQGSYQGKIGQKMSVAWSLSVTSQAPYSLSRLKPEVANRPIQKTQLPTCGGDCYIDRGELRLPYGKRPPRVGVRRTMT